MKKFLIIILIIVAVSIFGAITYASPETEVPFIYENK